MQLVICRDGDQAGLRTGDEPSRTAERASGNSLAEFVDLPPTPCEVAQSRQPQDVINRVQPANATARCGLYGRGNPPLAGPVVELAIRAAGIARPPVGVIILGLHHARLV